MKQHAIAFAAGTSGGHIIPCLTLAQKEDGQKLFFSTNTPLDQTLIALNKHIDVHIPFNITSKRHWYDYPRLAWQLARATWDSFWHLKRHNVKKIISTGGLIALPVCVAGWLQNIPIELWELNATPGSAIAWSARFATTIITPIKHAQSYFPADKCAIKNYPIQYAHNQNEKKYELFNFDPHKKTIFILGGSQGSLFLNSAIKTLFESNNSLQNKLQIIHQTGANDSRDWQYFYQNKGITAHVFSFSNNLRTFYALADLVVCRSGSGTLHETIFFEKPFITIPLETHTTNHQVDNALAMQELHPELCSVLLQGEIDKLGGLVMSKLNI